MSEDKTVLTVKWDLPEPMVFTEYKDWLGRKVIPVLPAHPDGTAWLVVPDKPVPKEIRDLKVTVVRKE